MVTKEEARTQFDYMTTKLNLKHTFTFDEMWDYMMTRRIEGKPEITVLPDKRGFREKIMRFEGVMRSIPGAILTGVKVDELNPLKHTFADGCYIREIFNPKGELIVTKIHKVAHPYFLLKGDMSIATEEGPKRVKAPYYGVTPAGTKRIIYTHEDCVFVTVHVTKETDLRKIEEEVIAKDFLEIDELEVKKFIDVVSEKEA